MFKNIMSKFKKISKVEEPMSKFKVAFTRPEIEGKEYLTINSSMYRSRDIFWDISKSIPLPNGVVDEIDAGWEFSYGTNKLLMLNEIHRVLKSGGILKMKLPMTAGMTTPKEDEWWNTTVISFFINDELRTMESIYPKFDLDMIEKIENEYEDAEEYEITLQKVSLVLGSDISIEKKEYEHIFKQEKENIAIVKYDNEKRIIYGVVFQPETPDSDGEVISEEEIEKAMIGYMEDLQRFDTEHDLKIRDDVKLIENYIAPQDLQFTYRDKDTTIKKGSWIQGVRVYNDSLWQDIQDGNITGFSPWGFGKKEEVAS